jgi:transcriptional regulator with XRE-family HTH domain
LQEGGLFLEIKVGELIKARREEKNIPLSILAETVGISPGYLSKLENGHKANPKLEILLRITNELGMDFDALLGIEPQVSSLPARIPSLVMLILAKERNSKVLENKDVQKKISSILDKALESKYLIEDEQLYATFLEDVYIQMETTLKRYISIQILMNQS